MAYRLLALSQYPWTNPDLLSIGPLGTKLSENLVEIHSNASIDENTFENDVCKMAAILSQPQFVKLLRPR